MDVFKTKPGVSVSQKITEEHYTNATKLEPPYVAINERGAQSYYAVCPECENPIQIIGLFKNTSERNRRPYGKHHLGSIPRLAAYNKRDYEVCPYSNPKWKQDNIKRHPDSRVAMETLKLLREQFDRVIYLLGKSTDMYIGPSVAKKMLWMYLGNEGWRYRTATLNNLPWTFGEGYQARELFGQSIVKDSGLHKAILKSYPEVCFEDVPGRYVKISKSKEYIDLSCILCNHIKYVDDNDVLHETIEFRVIKGNHTNSEFIFQKTIEIDSGHFMNLIALSPEKANRQEVYLKIAAEMIRL